MLFENNEIYDDNKQKIIDLFKENVKVRKICLKDYKFNHNGKEGYWLENKMGIENNSKNAPDLYGYEMKKMSNKISFGDFSASEYIFSKNRKEINNYNNWNDEIKVSRIEFIHYFGNKNPNKNNRFSWSGKCVPSYEEWNYNGLKIEINIKNDILIRYSFSNDKRNDKDKLPEFIKKENLVILLWKSEKMEKHINNKFNKKGFFLCKKNNGVYENICFGKPFNYEYFIECFKNKKIIFDSGMYEGNNRNYSHFRASNFWINLITEEY